MTEHKKYMLFSNCIPIKGYARSIIYDVMRYDYNYIPNDLFEILSKNNGIIDCKEYFHIYQNEIESLQIFIEYLDFLLEEEYIFPLNNLDEKLFPQMSLEFHSPSLISNAIIDIKLNSNLEKIKSELENVSCNYIMLRIQEEINIDNIKSILKTFNGSLIFSIQLILMYESSLNKKKLEQITSEFSFISHILVENTPEIHSFILSDEKSDTFTVTFKHTRQTENYKKSFILNSKIFTESQHKNTFYNKKVYIGTHGEIKNSPYNEESFGNIYNDHLKEIISSKDFQKYWNISKDNILVCRDCEHRYMCIDPRIPLQKESEEWFFNSECEYNPYTNEWQDN